MKTRIISAVVAIAIAVVLLFLNSYTVIVCKVFVAFIGGVSIYEIFSAIKPEKPLALEIPCITFSVLLPFVPDKFVALVIFLFTLVVFVAMIFKKKYFGFKNIAVIYSMTLILTVAFRCLAMLDEDAGQDGTFIIIFSLMIPWIADAGAYFVGRKLGKHKLAPDISPKKTIEGAIGGTVFCIIVTVIVCLIFELTGNLHSLKINYLIVITVAFVGSLLSICGDLTFSYMKRTYNIKDFGNFLPGHGGIIDRFDSTVFFLPFLYIVSSFGSFTGGF